MKNHHFNNNKLKLIYLYNYMDQRLYKHIKTQKEVLKENIREADDKNSENDIKKVDEMYYDLKNGNDKHAVKILDELAEKYKHKNSKYGLHEAAIVTSIITSILLSISLAIGIYRAGKPVKTTGYVEI